MNTNKNKFIINLILIINLIQLINCKRNFWPPLSNKVHQMELEKSIVQVLDKGCSSQHFKWTKKQEPEHFFVVTNTEHLGFGDPDPTQFTHIPSGNQINFNSSCSDCKPNEFEFDGTTYNSNNFECRNLCIFTAKRIEGDCKFGMINYRVSVLFSHKHLEIYNRCHRFGELQENKSNEINIDFLRKTAHEYLGQYSSKVWLDQITEGNCVKKCLPVCRQSVSGIHDDDEDDFISYEPSGMVTPKLMIDEHVDATFYTDSLMYNLCSYNNRKFSNANSTRLKDAKCSSVTINPFGSFIVLLIYLSTKLF